MRSNVCLGHTETLLGARALPFGPLPLLPTLEHIGQVVLGVVGLGQRQGGRDAELVFRQQRLALVIEAPAVGLHVVEPDMIGAAGVGFGEHQKRRRDPGIGLETAGGQ